MTQYDEKKLKKVIKEGGKRGVEIEGAADMGGLQFFCTKVDEPEGDLNLLLESVKAMNTQANPDDEERKGCSGHIGKMVFSCDSVRLCVVAYVPEEKKGLLDARDWIKHVVGLYDGKSVSGDETTASGEILSDPAAGKFALKIRDEALPKSIEFLRSKGLFPEAKEESSDDDVCYGDDFFETI